ncbi:hypothetical protein AQUCO_08200018v1 [Aquilegia coerulea]|uniref:Uncharacterized protein n=1 Tax=Aquilegia coerulea TaxID=218851 RepID=A0A2G5C7G7_AQUCA|nr:hypothetical protein AQUCO_08200018v1 [Aquilegia coerulea]
MGSPSLLRHGYDRKAQLLAYARKLRSSNYGSHNPTLPKKNFPSKTKWKWRRFREKCFSWRIFSPSRNKQWKYEHISTLDTKQTKNLNYYMKRLRCIFREVSSCKWNWKCNKS